MWRPLIFGAKIVPIPFNAPILLDQLRLSNGFNIANQKYNGYLWGMRQQTNVDIFGTQ